MTHPMQVTAWPPETQGTICPPSLVPAWSSVLGHLYPTSHVTSLPCSWSLRRDLAKWRQGPEMEGSPTCLLPLSYLTCPSVTPAASLVLQTSRTLAQPEDPRFILYLLHFFQTGASYHPNPKPGVLGTSDPYGLCLKAGQLTPAASPVTGSPQTPTSRAGPPDSVHLSWVHPMGVMAEGMQG